MAYSKETKQHAKQLFEQGKPIAVIASRIGCDEKTVRNWISKYNWRGDGIPAEHPTIPNRSEATALVRKKHQYIWEQYEKLIWDSEHQVRRNKRDVIQKLANEFFVRPVTVRKIIAKKQAQR
ncbi:terminase gpP N-terminus-related DNA-binding protein [Tunicatimonas pelagia]|uniref:terminase gpP N-terminus-related DNA-binding protein n=1 Tax=Tunicatimonas pelagia TaxID=931531 RepID=UPI00266682C4|nr:helix-turn-helix domain-containing protein [Tunicatimonas pelagia]WKN42205.1 helix-turn-helix domain-containing protein [Tunicatimonas pelagia]WKN45323.1 helix-turn-helix domain-containing protein [Tunicatimonas pelagia]